MQYINLRNWGNQHSMSLAVLYVRISSRWAVVGFGPPLLPQEFRPFVPLTALKSSKV